MQKIQKGTAEMTEVKKPDRKAMEAASYRWNHIAKPLHGLGVLEEDIIRIAGMTGDPDVDLEKKAVVIMCADNGVVEEGVSQTGQEVTAAVTRNFTNGNASVCIMAERAGAQVVPVDVGVADSLEGCGRVYPLRSCKIMAGTRNFAKEEAMTEAEARAAVQVGIGQVRHLKETGVRIIATGEMGIGNTTTSSAVASVLLGKEAAEVTGRGAGLSDEALERKIHVIEKAIALHRPDWRDPLDVIRKVGGLDIAGLAGVFLGGAMYGVPIVVDGFISAVAALTAERLCPGCADYMIASHVSAEPAGEMVLNALGLKPVIRAGMCLGEGTGAVAVLPLLQMAVDVYRRMSTFQENDIEEYEEFSHA